MNDRLPRNEPILDLENEIGNIVRPKLRLAEDHDPQKGETKPKVHDLGRLTSEAVLAQYEGAAKSVEALGVAVKESVAKLEEALKDHDQDLELIAEAANQIREKGKLVQVQIETSSLLTKDIRDICAGFTKKVS